MKIRHPKVTIRLPSNPTKIGGFLHPRQKPSIKLKIKRPDNNPEDASDESLDIPVSDNIKKWFVQFFARIGFRVIETHDISHEEMSYGVSKDVEVFTLSFEPKAYVDNTCLIFDHKVYFKHMSGQQFEARISDLNTSGKTMNMAWRNIMLKWKWLTKISYIQETTDGIGVVQRKRIDIPIVDIEDDQTLEHFVMKQSVLTG